MTNNKLSELQQKEIADWDGNDVLIIYPNDSTGHMKFSFLEQTNFRSDEYLCGMKKLDELGLPKMDNTNGQIYSLVGRIMLLNKNKNND